MNRLDRFPYGNRMTANGRLLLIYRGGAKATVRWHQAKIETEAAAWEATRRRLRLRVLHGGKR